MIFVIITCSILSWTVFLGLSASRICSLLNSLVENLVNGFTFLFERILLCVLNIQLLLEPLPFQGYPVCQYLMLLMDLFLDFVWLFVAFQRLKFYHKTFLFASLLLLAQDLFFSWSDNCVHRSLENNLLVRMFLLDIVSRVVEPPSGQSLSNTAKSDSAPRFVRTSYFLFCTAEGSLSPSVKKLICDIFRSRVAVTSLACFYCSLLTPLELLFVLSILHLRFWMLVLNSCLIPLHDRYETEACLYLSVPKTR